MQKFSTRIIMFLVIACVTAYIGIFIGRVSLDSPFNKEHSTTNDDAVRSEDFLININTADVNSLMDLPGMYQELANEIIQYRNRYGGFIAPKELLNLENMTDDIYNQLMPYITLGGKQ